MGTQRPTNTIEANIGLVHSCARRFTARGIEYDDLFQAGCLGLVKAAQNFEPQRGLMFSTYAVPVILGEIKRLFRDGGTVKVSRQLKERYLQIHCICERYAKSENRDPTLSEIARELGCEQTEAALAISAARTPLSLTAAEDDRADFDVPDADREEEIAEKLSLQQAVQKLSDAQQQIVSLRFAQGKTQAETARITGTTQVQISRHERKIIAQLREFMSDGA